MQMLGTVALQPPGETLYERRGSRGSVPVLRVCVSGARLWVGWSRPANRTERCSPSGLLVRGWASAGTGRADWPPL